MSHPLKLICVISEGRPGHENQSVGLAMAIARRTGAEVEIVKIPATWSLWARSRAALQVSKGIPDLLIGAGHKVHLPLWFASKKFRARSVVIMDPTWSKRLFNLCILPQHDTDPAVSPPHVITTLGALNRLPETVPIKETKGLILIGGPSKSHGWSAETAATAIIAVIHARPELAWTISDSRRTPTGFLDQLRAQKIGVEIVSHEQTKPDWVPAQLMAAQEAWVTEDSVSMIFEAVTAGARTGVLPAPVIKPTADTVRAVRKLVREGYATDFETWTRNGRQLPAPKRLHETGRCADLVLARLFGEKPAMKVLQILPELNAGGVERVVMVMAEYLAANSHQSLVVSNGGRLVTALEKSGTRHIALPVHRKSLATLLQVRPLRKILEQEHPDILHVHSRVPGWIAWLAWRKMNPQTRPHLVSTVHGFYSVNAYSAIMARGERIIAVSACIRDYIQASFPRTPANLIRLVRHGIDPAHDARGFQPDATWLERWQKEFPQFAGKHLLLLPGRITRLKGHEIFLRLIALLRKTRPDIHGVIVGDTHSRKRAYLTELQRLVAQLNLTNDITFVGHRSDLREVLAVCDVTYSLSTSPESFGLTSLEALALGRPVIGYDHGGVGELLREFFPAGRVPLRDEAALIATTQKLLSVPHTPAPVKEPFTLDAMCRGTLDVYRESIQPSRTA